MKKQQKPSTPAEGKATDPRGRLGGIRYNYACLKRLYEGFFDVRELTEGTTTAEEKLFIILSKNGPCLISCC